MTEQQFLSAYDEYADAIFRHCTFRTGERELGRDLMQDTFMKAWEYIAKGKEVENIRAFLYCVANNLVVDELRKRKKNVSSLEDMQERGFDVEGDEDSTEKTQQSFTCSQVTSLLSKIEEPYRSAVVMRYIDDLSPAEISECLQVSPNVVSVRINRGTKMLRSYLNDEQ